MSVSVGYSKLKSSSLAKNSILGAENWVYTLVSPLWHVGTQFCSTKIQYKQPAINKVTQWKLSKILWAIIQKNNGNVLHIILLTVLHPKSGQVIS